MKKLLPALALLLAAASAHAAPLFTFDLTASVQSANATVNPWSYTSFHSTGARLNETTTYVDDVWTFGDVRYVWHYADVSYQQYGSYRDSYYFSVATGPATGADSYVYVSGTVSYDTTRLAGPALLSSSAYTSGSYTLTPNARFPSVGMMPAGVTFAAAQSADPAALVAQQGSTSFDTDYTFFAYVSKDFTITDGGSELGFLLYAGQYLTPSEITVSLYGQEYDTGLHQISERQYLGFEILPVPEPSTYAMLLAGVVVLAVARRRRVAR